MPEPRGVRDRRLDRSRGRPALSRALLLGYYDPDGRLVYAGRAGTGIGHAELGRLWHHEQVCRRIGSSAEAAAEVFEGWIGTVESLQAWIARAAWIPEFNTYEEFAQTVYESAVAPDWHRVDRPPRMPWLRFVAARLWLDESFVEALDPRQLEAVAELSRHGRVTALSLRPGRSLAELEAALAAILPRFRGGQLPKE
jgi:hypothetical protein